MSVRLQPWPRPRRCWDEHGCTSSLPRRRESSITRSGAEKTHIAADAAQRLDARLRGHDGGMSVYSIPAGESFVDALARQLLIETAGEPTKLADMLILLPTRRACRALQEGFLRASEGKPLLLPRLQPLGDDDEEDIGGEDLDLRPAVPPLQRRLLRG